MQSLRWKQGRKTVHQIGQFTHIARPSVGLEQFQHVGRKFQRTLTGQHMLVGIKSQQAGNVIRPLAQCRGGDGQHVDAVVKVFTEAPRSHFCFEIFVGGGHHAHVDRHLTRAPHGQDAAFLQNTKQLDLHVHGQVADFVQKQGATMGQLKAPQTVGHGPGEGTFAMTEEFAFNQVTRNGPAIDGHKGPCGSRPLCMQRLRHQLFARPTLTGDQGSR